MRYTFTLTYFKSKANLMYYTNELFFLVVSFVSVFIFFRIMRLNIAYTNYPLISVFFLVHFLVFAYIGPLIHIFYENKYNEFFYLNQFLLSTSVLILFPLGMLSINKILKFDGYFLYDYDHRSQVSDKMFYVFLALFFLSICVLLLFISKLEMLPITAIIKGYSVADAYELRSAAGNTFPGKYYRYAMFMKTLPLVLLLILFFLRDISRRWSILFYILLIYNIFVSIMDIQKAPLLNLLFLLLICGFFYYKKINWKLFFSVMIVSGVAVILMYMFFLDSGNFVITIDQIISRIIFAQIDTFIDHQRYIEANGFLYGKSFPNPAGIFPFVHIPIETEIYKFVIQNWHEGMPLGSWPTVFYGNWYDNFGYFGALFSMFLLGMIIQFADIKLYRHISAKKHILVIGLYIYLIHFFSKYAGTSFDGILIDTQLIFPIIITFFLFYINGYFLKKEIACVK